jgi:L,D-transpeptidase ErfK/SrfK
LKELLTTGGIDAAFLASSPRVSLKLMPKKLSVASILVLMVLAVAFTAPSFAHAWNDAEFNNRPLYAYPLPRGRDDILGSLTTYKTRNGDTLLDVGRWFGLSAKEVSDANGRLDWWSPPPGKEIILPSEHILPEGPRVGIVMNIPEMRLYYFYPSPTAIRHKGKEKLTPDAFSRAQAQVVYTFPVGLGRFDWKTPVGAWTVVAKTKNPTWVVPQDIYEEHLERDGEAEHVIYGDDPDNPLGHYRLSLSIPEYALHGTNVPWGVGMNISHGCIRLYPEDIERLFSKVKIGTPGRFVYQPVKFGWRGDSLYVEVHDDIYGKYPGLWNHAANEVKRLGLGDQVDLKKLEKAVEARSGIPTYVMPGPDPNAGLENANTETPSATESATTATAAPANPSLAATPTGGSANSTDEDSESAPANNSGEWERGLPAHIVKDHLPIE